MNRTHIDSIILAAGLVFLAGCGDGGGGGGLRNRDPGDNDVAVVVAFGDSFTKGNTCECDPYPRRLGPLIEKTVLNTGVPGSLATENVARTQEAIDKYHPGFMLILYGVNDIIHGIGTGAIVQALEGMVETCKENQVVPVLATYPEPLVDYVAFADRVLLLNTRIRELAKELDLSCVDLEHEFEANPEFYEDIGLHPNDAGTQVMALAFADLF